jgi:uncharacterized protein (DUF1330 family)
MTKYYSHIECTPTEMDWLPAYMDSVPGLVAKHGGRFVYRTTEADAIEMPDGEALAFTVCIEWPSADAAEAFYTDPDYQSHKQRRLNGSTTRWYNAPAFAS